MSSLILIFHLAVAVVLVGVILLQRSEGGALGIGGGGSGGGGNNYYLTVEVPLEVLRDEPNLAANAERLGETIMKNIRGQS